MERCEQLEINCSIRNQPVALQTDICADEDGKAVHEECYLTKIKMRDTAVNAN